ncbi:MAG: GIY-YIG nuclease family protein [Chloroflexi bacterium]|nr:GIY-YIG nuclease family protein [Chloroflexota bacterium]MBU1747218.1 GIY-YIG nuclease family protein [Chloroflexota bacterium]
MIYIIQAGDDGPLKIGRAANPQQRLAELQHGSPAPLQLRATLPGGRTEERALCARFAAHRLHGEWFAPAAELLDWVQRQAPAGA